jgi:hypothetical protein
MRPGDFLAVSVTTLFGAVTGWLISGTFGAAIGAVLFGVLAFVGVRASIRPAVITTVLVGTMAGGLFGSSIVQAICLPSSCPALEAASGIVAAVLSFIGVGLVAALVTRSFDEYNEREAAGLPPTGVGCEVPDPSDDQ